LTDLHDYNSEFYTLDTTGTLINSSFGIGPDTSQVGPSIFPTTALTVRLKYLPTSNSYLQAAVYDGVPGNPNNERGTHSRFDKGDGTFIAVEAGLIKSDENAFSYKLGIGLWQHTANYIDFLGVPRNENNGIQLFAERSLYQESQDSSQGLGVFLQVGSTHDDRNVIARYYGAGLSLAIRDCLTPVTRMY